MYCLITGASKGIGKATAREFASHGHNLILTARSERKLLTLKEQLHKRYGVSVEVIVQDLATPDGAKDLYEEVKRRGLVVTGLINNAGLGELYPFVDSDWAKQKELIDVNVVALMQLCHLFGSDMKQRHAGHILNVSSVAAFFAGPNMASYYASKAFVSSFSEALADELEPYGVSVSVIFPSPTETNFSQVAGMRYSNMFRFKKPLTSSQVARAIYRQFDGKSSLNYYSFFTKLTGHGSRITPRFVSRKIAKWINGTPDYSKKNTES